MTRKYLDLTGVAYFKSKLDTATASAIQNALQTALADYVTDVNLFTVVSTLPSTGVEGRGYLVPNANDSSKYDIYTWETVNGTAQWVGGGGGSVTITVDTTLSTSSNNPIANSAVATALNGKAASNHVHGNITNDGKLSTASRVVVTDGNKLVTVSNVTSTELGYVAGVTSAIQTQIDSKESSSNLVAITNNEIDALFS